MTVEYEVIAVRYGTLVARRSALYLHWDAYGEPDGDERLDYFFYVLRHAGDTIVLDTGFHPDAGERRGRTCLRHPRDALADLGIDRDGVSRVIVSHLHYDHIGNLDLFPRARVYVPERELSFWTSDIARHPQFSRHVEPATISQLIALERQNRVDRYDGTRELVPGIRAITVAGHSPGQQVFVVETAGEPLVLASDAVHFYEELEHDRPFAIVVNLLEMYRAYEMLRELRQELGAAVVPGHDPLVTERFEGLSGTPPGLAFRLA
ncbi:MAG: N-acyl homoserine lactonase family protein [Solirubrobacterales bacterium]|nr:N-acyl homoserine lactonase family protein [Solirubrobacterales bacterium]